MIWTILEWYLGLSMACLAGTILVARWDRLRWFEKATPPTPRTTEPDTSNGVTHDSIAEAPAPTVLLTPAFPMLEADSGPDIGPSQRNFNLSSQPSAT
jgi:hypothetical protein